MSRNNRRRGVAVLPSMAPVSSARAESDRLNRVDPGLALLARGADADSDSQQWPKLALAGACLVVLAAGWWFYRDDAGDRGDRTIAPALAAELPAATRQGTKPAEFEELLEKQRRLAAELDQKFEQLAARQDDQQSLAQARERIKELERQIATSREAPPVQQQPVPPPVQQPPPQQPTVQQAPVQQPSVQQPTTASAAANDPGNEAPVYRPPEVMPKPQPALRRSGSRPVPKATQPMPRLSLQVSDLNYNPAGYWQVTATLVSNTSRALDARVQCSFLSSGRPVDAAEFGPTSVAPGEQVSIDLIGPPTSAHLDSTTCRLAGQ